jgi:hypothetical protein
VRDLFLIIHVDGHLIKELPGGFHAAVWMIRGEDDPVDTDCDKLQLLSIAPDSWPANSPARIPP